MPKVKRERFLSDFPLLITESRKDYQRLVAELEQAVKPCNAVEQLFINDLAYQSWEIMRLRRAKTAIINLAVREALNDLIKQLGDDIYEKNDDDASEEADEDLGEPDTNDELPPEDSDDTSHTSKTDDDWDETDETDTDDAPLSIAEQADKWSYDWFQDEKIKKSVAELLQYYGLDESAIEAKAYCLCAEDLEKFDRQIISLESRYRMTLRSVADYRSGFARRLARARDELLASDVVTIEHHGESNSIAPK
jgi:hypothetical protein